MLSLKMMKRRSVESQIERFCVVFSGAFSMFTIDKSVPGRTDQRLDDQNMVFNKADE